MNYVVATIKDWNIRAFGRWIDRLPGHWSLVARPSDLAAVCESLHPRYVFFPHWSWKVPAEILERHECVCFHMADVPYGRGGSPLQNLIQRGHSATKLSALRMVEELDAGPVYMKRDVSLHGPAHEIFERIAHTAYQMMLEIVETQPTPVPQEGEPTYFPRRKPKDSEVPVDGRIEALYDHIRMLDAPTYPPAFLEYGRWVFEFEDARLAGDEVFGRFSVRRKESSKYDGKD